MIILKCNAIFCSSFFRQFPLGHILKPCDQNPIEVYRGGDQININITFVATFVCSSKVSQSLSLWWSLSKCAANIIYFLFLKHKKDFDRRERLRRSKDQIMQFEWRGVCRSVISPTTHLSCDGTSRDQTFELPPPVTYVIQPQFNYQTSRYHATISIVKIGQSSPGNAFSFHVKCILR